jgi:hypothetical protein
MNSRQALRFATAFVALNLCSPAQAAFRAYLASDGNDANPCSLAAPCRLLPAALTAVDVGGEIWMLDSANYNSAQVEVTKSVSILAIPGALGSVVAIGGGNGLNINTAGVKVSLRNLVIVQLGAGNFGVNFTNGSELTILNCEIANHPGMGGAIYAASSGGKLTIKDTIIRNSQAGLYIANGMQAVLDRVRVENNSMGIYSGNSRLAVNNSVISGNGSGITVNANGNSTSYGTIARSEISGNAYGVVVQGGFTAMADPAIVVLADSSLSNNTSAAIQALQGAGLGPITLVLDGNTIAHNANILVTQNGTLTVRTRTNNTFFNNAGGDTLTSTGLAPQ